MKRDWQPNWNPKVCWRYTRDFLAYGVISSPIPSATGPAPVGISFDHRGEQALKCLAEPRRVFAVTEKSL